MLSEVTHQYSAFLIVFSKLFIFKVLGTVCSFAIQRSGIQVHIYICSSTCCFCFHLLLHFLLDSQLQINSILFTLKWNTIIWQLAYSTILEVQCKFRIQVSQATEVSLCECAIFMCFDVSSTAIYDNIAIYYCAFKEPQ